MAKRSTTSSFIAEFPLRVTRAAGYTLEKRFKAGGSLYNGALGEVKRRAGAMRADPEWAKARSMPVGDQGERRKRSAAFKTVAERHGFSEYALQKYAEDMRDRSWIGHHLGGHDTQTTSRRAFRAVADWVYKGRGRPRFRPCAQFSSIEGKENSTISYREGAVSWSGLKLPLVRNPRDPGNWERDSLACRTKYVRIVRRKVRGRMRYYAQLVQEGNPPTRDLPLAKGGVGGLDIGPSTVAVVAPGKAAALLPLAPSVDTPAAQIRRLQRKMDRSRRASNPDNYNLDGTVKRGRRLKWHRTRRYIAIQEQKAEIERRLAEGRARDHGTLVNQLLSLCAVWKAEKLSYRSFQKNFGRSVARRAPSMLLSTLSRKAASAGGKLVEFPTRSTRLSQFDHSMGNYVKKPLSQRLHVFGDPRITPVQRDLYSAFLACYVEDSLLSIASVNDAWPGAEPLLRQPMAELKTICERAAAFGASATGPQSVRADRLHKAMHGCAGPADRPPGERDVLLEVGAGGHPADHSAGPTEKPIPLRNGRQCGETSLRSASAVVVDPGPARIPRL